MFLTIPILAIVTSAFSPTLDWVQTRDKHCFPVASPTFLGQEHVADHG